MHYVYLVVELFNLCLWELITGLEFDFRIHQKKREYREVYFVTLLLILFYHFCPAPFIKLKTKQHITNRLNDTSFHLNLNQIDEYIIFHNSMSLNNYNKTPTLVWV